jgi:murein DD-endopeptidase MepM/ murein hydrolase activator NlpD
VTPIRTGGSNGLVGSFGPVRRNPDGSVKDHKGIDLLCVVNWPVFAVHGGTVVVAGWENEADPSQGYGRRVKIETAMGQLRTVYAHLGAIKVKKGDKVQQGDIIAVAGRSGNIGDTAIPTHLHFEVHRVIDNELVPVDPVAWTMGVEV